MILETIATLLTDPEVVNDIRASWTYETSADSINWPKSHPSHGQCAVTSLLVQRISGGLIQRSDAILPHGETLSHWYNVIDGEKLDLTAEQFPAGTTFRAKGEPMAEEEAVAYAFKNEATQRRFYKLLENFMKARARTLGLVRNAPVAA